MTTERFYAFESLPPPSLVQQVDAAAIAALRIAGLQADVPGWDGDPTDAVTKNIENGAAREQNLRLWIDSAARSHTKRFSEGTDTDNLLALIGVDRLTGESDTLYKPQGYGHSFPAGASNCPCHSCGDPQPCWKGGTDCGRSAGAGCERSGL